MSRRGDGRLPGRVVRASLTWGVGGALILGGSGGGAALAAPATSSKIPPRCERLVERTAQFEPRVDYPSQTLTWRDRSIPLTGRGLASYVPRTNQEALWLHSLAWLVPMATYDPDQAERLVAEYVEAFPDPGPQVSGIQSRLTGWTEGQIRRRLESLECLYLATGSPMIADRARDLGAALMDDRRYYGLPFHAPHNHGAQTNRLLTRIGPLFGRQEWVAKSRERTRRDLVEVFAECGMSNEQSSGYQWMNVSLWEGLAESVDVPMDSAPRNAARALVRPDGVVEAVGDGRLRIGKSGGGYLWCDDEGWAANTREGMHYVLRFGPTTKRHGHADHAAVTWFTRGAPVLVDRGTGPKSDPEAFDWSRGVAAHSTLERVGATDRPAMTGRRVGLDSYVVESTSGDRHRRYVRFNPDSVVVTDRARAPQVATWVQHWHFAPGWQPQRGSGGAATGEMIGPQGAVVRLSCAQSGEPVMPEPVRVRSYAGDSPQWAWDMQCRSRGAQVAFDSEIRWIEGE